MSHERDQHVHGGSAHGGADPVVIVRLPYPRPKATPRAWTEEEDARLQQAVEGSWPEVGWVDLAHELDREVHEVITRSTYLHLQYAKRQQPPEPPEASMELQRRVSAEDESHSGVSEGSGVGGVAGSPVSGASRHHGLGVTQLAADIAALAVRHHFDWKTIGSILKTDPWECWKIYETHCHSPEMRAYEGTYGFKAGGAGSPPSGASMAEARLMDRRGTSPTMGGQAPREVQTPALSALYQVSEGSHGALADSSLFPDDIPAFLPTRHPRQHSNTTTTGATPSPLSPSSSPHTHPHPHSPHASPPPIPGVPHPASYLHHFPRHQQRARPMTPLANMLRPGSASTFMHQQQQHQQQPHQQHQQQQHRPPGDALGFPHMHESTMSTAGGGAGGGVVFMPGQDSLSLSALESALLDMPSLYLGHSRLGASALSLSGSMLSSISGGGMGPAGGGPPFNQRAFTSPAIPDTIQESDKEDSTGAAGGASTTSTGSSGGSGGSGSGSGVRGEGGAVG